LALERSHLSAFNNGARFFAGWGTVLFAFWFASLALYAWQLAYAIRDEEISSETIRLQGLLLILIVFGLVVSFIASSYEFLRRVYRVRKFLTEHGGIKFANWPETVIAFGLPIANFFVPWNRLDSIRATLRLFCETGNITLALNPEKKLRTLGIVWGILSCITIQGSFEGDILMFIFLVANTVSFALSLWTFNMATRWLSELQFDFEKVTIAAG
jgi:hypothetical protein